MLSVVSIDLQSGLQCHLPSSSRLRSIPLADVAKRRSPAPRYGTKRIVENEKLEKRSGGREEQRRNKSVAGKQLVRGEVKALHCGEF
jgi:hypothetical protein